MRNERQVVQAWYNGRRISRVNFSATLYSDAFLSLLCSSCLPEGFSLKVDVPPGGWEIVGKHLQGVHMLLNSALCLGALMDSGWTLIIATCQQVRSGGVAAVAFSSANTAPLFPPLSSS